MLELFGRYQLIKKLATGGMGQVFLARQKGPVGFEKLVVVKRILPHISEEEDFIQMFFDEARIAAHLNHPNIVQIYDLGEVDGTYYIAMEYVHGDSLRAVNNKANQEKSGLPLPLKCRIIAEGASALDFAHQARSPSGKPLSLIHRDVSPQNILVGFNGSVKLIDFGVAKAAGKISTTLAGAIKGKYAYMSPEQARGEDLDLRSDIFGLGTVFFELLTSTRLFKRESETATLKAVVSAKVPPPSSIIPEIPKALDTIVLKALAKRRQDRFQTAGEFEMALQEFIISNRLAATSTHLAAFMRELYIKELADEKLSPEPTAFGYELPPRTRSKKSSQTSGTPAHRPPPPARSRRTERAPERQAPEPAERPVSKTKPPGAGRAATSDVPARRDSTRSASGASRPRDDAGSVSVSRQTQALPPKTRPSDSNEDMGLEARLTATRPADTVRGLFFNAVLSTVGEHSGPTAETEVRLASVHGDYNDTSQYPTADFLRLLWKAAEVLGSSFGGMEQAFQELGIACMEHLLRSSLGQSLEQLSRVRDAQWLLTPLLASLGPLLRPGDRSVDGSSERSAVLSYRRDLMPPHFHVGFLTHALSKLRGVSAMVDVERVAKEEVAYRVQW